MEFIEAIGFLAAAFTTTAFLPQAIKILRTKQTLSLSRAMLGTQLTGNILWVVYGLLMHSPSLILANILTTSIVLWIILMKWHYERRS